MYDDVQWMGLLRSVNALQMYQRSPAGRSRRRAVRFLLLDPLFPRSVASCAIRDARGADRLPRVDQHVAGGRSSSTPCSAGLQARADDGAALDAAMDELLLALAAVNAAVVDAFVRSDH